MIAMWWMVALAQQPAEPATAKEAAEEIIVWGDPFARWDRRWVVETELRFAQPFTLYADNNLESRLSNLQIRAVLDCDRDVVLGPRREEVRCEVEDLSLIAMTSRPGRDDDLVLQEADAAMTGAHLELQVGANGGVPNVGIEGLVALNQRDRVRVEQYRQLLSRVILPFHLGLPPVVADGVKWYEYNSRLMAMPSSQASAGGTQIAHFMDVFEGRLLVQSRGKGAVTPMGDSTGFGTDPNTQMAVGVTGGVDYYDLDLHGVAVFDLGTGIMSERIWAFGGDVTASSANVLRKLQYGHRGHLRLLGDKDSPDVGLTAMARSHGEAPGDGPIWVPLADTPR